MGTSSLTQETQTGFRFFSCDLFFLVQICSVRLYNINIQVVNANKDKNGSLKSKDKSRNAQHAALFMVRSLKETKNARTTYYNPRSAPHNHQDNPDAERTCCGVC